jgi:hypothetical protein
VEPGLFFQVVPNDTQRSSLHDSCPIIAMYQLILVTTTIPTMIYDYFYYEDVCA